MDFGNLVGGLVDVVKVAAPLLGVGSAIKHVETIPILKQTVGQITKRIPNGAIPAVNLAIDLAIGGTGQAALAAGGFHQLLKVLLRVLIGRFGGKAIEAVQDKIGPGAGLSI